MIESILLIGLIVSATYVAIELGAHKLIAYAAAISLILFTSLQMSAFTSGFFWIFFHFKHTLLSLSMLIGFVLLFTWAAYRLSISRIFDKKGTALLLSQQLMASIFLAVLFTLSFAYSLRFCVDSGIVSETYADQSLPYKVIISFSRFGDHIVLLFQSMFETAEELTKSNFEPEKM